MITQILISLPPVIITILIHALGTVYLIMPLIRVRSRGDSQPALPPIRTLLRLISGLMALHFAETVIWALTFSIVGVFPNFESSLHYSLESYTTVGYGDIVPSTSWRLLGPIEAVVGVLMLGWSTSIIVTVVGRIYSKLSGESKSE